MLGKLNKLYMANKKLNIKSTCVPEKTVDINKWCKEFKVGSRVEKFSASDIVNDMNQQYDFRKLFIKTEDLGFIGKLKSLKLVDLW